MSDPTPFSEAVSASFRELTSVAGALNEISDALGKAVSDIDEGLKRLNLGISVWVRVDYSPPDYPEDPYYRIEEIGYVKFDGKWGMALRTTIGIDMNPHDEEDTVNTYAFNEAPRALRLKAIDKIPALLKALTDESAKVTKELEAKLADAQAVAAAVNPAGAKPNAPIKRKTLQEALRDTNVPVVGLVPTSEFGTVEGLNTNPLSGVKK